MAKDHIPRRETGQRKTDGRGPQSVPPRPEQRPQRQFIFTDWAAI